MVACDLPRGVWAVWFYSLTLAHHWGNDFSHAFFLNENVVRAWAALCFVIWTIFHHSPFYYVWKFIWDDEKAKLQTGLQPWGNNLGILFTGQGHEICPFEAFLLTHFWPGYTEEVDVWSAGDVVFLVRALESFHNMKLIKAEAHGAPPAWRPPPLNPGQNTLHISVGPCSKLSVPYQAVPTSPLVCSPNHAHIPCLYRTGPSSLPHPHMISDYVFIWVVIIRLSPQMNMRCHLIMFSTIS